jgi:WD40 repeat protein
MRKPLRREEWLLFLAPVVMLVAALWAGPLRRAYFPAPVPTPAPTPALPPIPNLWESYGEFYAILPDRNGKVIYTLNSFDRKRGQLISAWDARTGTLKRAFCGSRMLSRNGIALSDDGRKLAYTNDNYADEKTRDRVRIGIYDAKRGMRLQTLGNKPNPGTVIFLPHSHTLFVGMDGYFQIWNTDNGKLLKQKAWREDGAIANYLRLPCVSRDGRVLAVMHTDEQSEYANGGRDEIGLFSTRSWKRRRVLSWPHSSINALAFIGNGQTLLARTTSWYWAKKKSGANDVYPVTKLRFINLQTRRERVIETSPQWINNDLVVSPDRKYFALYQKFSATTPPVNRAANLLWEKSFLEIRDGFTGKKIASLHANEGFGNLSLAFAPDNSALYFSNYGLERWPRSKWKIGVAYSDIRMRGR